jgi:ABC-type multidrug transport system fused ATPase/permease subunit
MIVHQPHLLATADRVLVLEQGQVARIAPVVLRQAAGPTLDNAT